MSRKYIMLAAGGTGGHLFPAYALGEELVRRGYKIDLMTDMRGDRYGTGFPGETIYQIPSATFTGKSPLALLKTGWKLANGTRIARSIMKKNRPDAIIGFGGYPTFPPLIAAGLLKIPAALHEQNAVMGRANRAIAKRVQRIAASFDTTKFVKDEHREKLIVTGNPVRDMVVEASKQAYDPPKPGGPFHLLVFGGSQGARYFSDTVPQAVMHLQENLRNRLKIVQQCREEDSERVKQIYESAGVEAEVAPFFKNLPEYMAHAHLIVARSGASTVAELTVMARPSLLVPLPHALDNDQLLNATRLMEAGGAWCIAQKDLTPERLSKELVKFLLEPQRLVGAANAAKQVGKPEAVQALADVMEDLAENPVFKV